MRAFFNWLVDECEIDHSPLERVRPPRQEERPPDVLSDEEMLALLRVCEGRSFEDRRDAAIIRLLFDTGARVGELVSMRADRVSVAEGTARVMGKGRRERDLAFGMKVAKDLTRYLRLREGHRLANAPEFWLGWHGPLTETGVAQALKTRAERAGLDPPKVHPHILRHTFADRWKAAGGSEEDLMSLGGWRSPTAMRRYGSSLAAARAREAHHLAGRPPVTAVPVLPRVPKRWGVGRSLLCGIETCTGVVGGVSVSGVMHSAPLRLPPHPGSADMRVLVEAQAPPGARVAVVWVVPEGYPSRSGAPDECLFELPNNATASGCTDI